jgi:hypothetical protein
MENDFSLKNRDGFSMRYQLNTENIRIIKKESMKFPRMLNCWPKYNNTSC